jgi:hypothetical protein
MSEIKKNKGMVEFWIDGKAKPYVLDINKGRLIGLRGSALQTIPTAVRSLARSADTTVCRLVYNNYCLNGNADLYLTADKLDSIGYNATIWELSKHIKALQNVDFRKLARFIKTEMEKGNQYHLLDEYISKAYKEDWLTKTGLRVEGQLTEDMVDYIYRNWREESAENIKGLAYCFSRGLYEFFADDGYALRSKVDNMLYWLKELEWKFDKSDFFRQYINARRAYIAKADEIANRKMAEYQEYRRNALTFETDTHIVIIPTSVEELRNEGKAQGNCVGGYGSAVGNKERNVVFIRRKSDPNRAYITCDITRRGTINQYLAHHNTFVRDTQDLEFEALYQAHLYDNWGD